MDDKMRSMMENVVVGLVVSARQQMAIAVDILSALNEGGGQNQPEPTPPAPTADHEDSPRPPVPPQPRPNRR